MLTHGEGRAAFACSDIYNDVLLHGDDLKVSCVWSSMLELFAVCVVYTVCECSVCIGYLNDIQYMLECAEYNQGKLKNIVFHDAIDST